MTSSIKRLFDTVFDNGVYEGRVLIYDKDSTTGILEALDGECVPFSARDVIYPHKELITKGLRVCYNRSEPFMNRAVDIRVVGL